MQVTVEELRRLNLRELGEYYEVPSLTKWEGRPMKSCSCLRSTLTDMVIYTKAAMKAVHAMPAECHSSASIKPPDAVACLTPTHPTEGEPLAGDVLHMLGFAQQRQRVRGSRLKYQCDFHAAAMHGASQTLQQVPASARGKGGDRGPMEFLKRRASQVLAGAQQAPLYRRRLEVSAELDKHGSCC